MEQLRQEYNQWRPIKEQSDYHRLAYSLSAAFPLFAGGGIGYVAGCLTGRISLLSRLGYLSGVAIGVGVAWRGRAAAMELCEWEAAQLERFQTVIWPGAVGTDIELGRSYLGYRDLQKGIQAVVAERFQVGSREELAVGIGGLVNSGERFSSRTFWREVVGITVPYGVCAFWTAYGHSTFCDWIASVLGPEGAFSFVASPIGVLEAALWMTPLLAVFGDTMRHHRDRLVGGERALLRACVGKLEEYPQFVDDNTRLSVQERVAEVGV